MIRIVIADDHTIVREGLKRDVGRCLATAKAL
jgi:YesN/AraC family two-component response regulator